MKCYQNTGMLFLINLILYTLYLHLRTNLLLAIGIPWLGIITPCLQMVLAYLYFRFGHIWSRVLNAELKRATAVKESQKGTTPLYALKYLITRRALH